MARAYPIVREGDSTEESGRVKRALARRARPRGFPAPSSGNRMTPSDFGLWKAVAEALGVEKPSGSHQAAMDRYRVVRFPGRRTPTELANAREWRKRKKATSKAKPKIVRLNAPMTNNQGAIGPLREPVGHYTAGPRDTSDSHGLSLLRQYNAQHRRQGWGAIGYHLAILRSGTIVLCRPLSWRGTHTAMQNTGRVGIVVLGSGGQRMSAAQKRSLAYIRANVHTDAFPSSHRASSKLKRQTVHKDWNATSCAGDYSVDYRAAA